MNAQVIAPSSVQSKATVVFVCVLAALAGLMFGLDVGVISGATQFIQAEYKVGDHVIEWIVSSMMFGAAIGAVGAGWLSAHLG
ncbi:MFS transporter, partial [Salmonella enterica]